MKWVEAKFTHRDICPHCKYGVLLDSIPLGTVYEVDLERTDIFDFHCGGCGQVTRDVPVIFTRTNSCGYLPMGLFTIPTQA